MRTEEHIAALRHEGELLAEAAQTASLDAYVPTCPDWTVRDLVRHVGRVHRWAAAYVADARPTALGPDEVDRVWGPMPDDTQLVAWYRAGHANIVETLEKASGDVECWTFLPAPTPLAFWARRQAHETAIHRADVQSAVGAIAEVAGDLAVDGIDELLCCFFSRPRNRLRSDAVKTLGVTATDVDAGWIVYIGPDGARADRRDTSVSAQGECEIRGPASALYLGLWNRRSLHDLDVLGNAELLDLWRDKATVRWS
jgi:uncharacterized protein (TIGR03083 family)